MKTRALVLLGFAALAAGGCSTPAQGPLTLHPAAVDSQAGTIGVAMAELPKPDTYFPGAGCLLCMGAASLANSTLTNYAQTLSCEDLPEFKAEVAATLRKSGAKVVEIAEPLKIGDLSKSDASGANLAPLDYRSLGPKYKIDKILILSISSVGFTRTYSAYVPTSDPKATLSGAGYLVNLKSNSYEWYQPISIVKSASGEWDEPPKFPGLTNAYFQTLELAKDSIRSSINEGISPSAPAAAPASAGAASAPPAAAPASAPTAAAVVPAAPPAATAATGDSAPKDAAGTSGTHP